MPITGVLLLLLLFVLPGVGVIAGLSSSSTIGSDARGLSRLPFAFAALMSAVAIHLSSYGVFSAVAQPGLVGWPWLAARGEAGVAAGGRLLAVTLQAGAVIQRADDDDRRAHGSREPDRVRSARGLLLSDGQAVAALLYTFIVSIAGYGLGAGYSEAARRRWRRTSALHGWTIDHVRHARVPIFSVLSRVGDEGRTVGYIGVAHQVKLNLDGSICWLRLTSVVRFRLVVDRRGVRTSFAANDDDILPELFIPGAEIVNFVIHEQNTDIEGSLEDVRRDAKVLGDKLREHETIPYSD